MGEILMQRGNSICYNSKMFHGGDLKYPIYGKELYGLVQVVKK
jgi:hypothetical protein